MATPTSALVLRETLRPDSRYRINVGKVLPKVGLYAIYADPTADDERIIIVPIKEPES